MQAEDWAEKSLVSCWAIVKEELLSRIIVMCSDTIIVVSAALFMFSWVVHASDFPSCYNISYVNEGKCPSLKPKKKMWSWFAKHVLLRGNSSAFFLLAVLLSVVKEMQCLGVY